MAHKPHTTPSSLHLTASPKAGRWKFSPVVLPKEARHLGGRDKEGFGEYYREVLAPKKSYERDSNGNAVSRWVDYNKPDHFFHAEAYALLAGAHRWDGAILPLGRG